MSNTIERKYLSRKGWKRVQESAFTVQEFSYPTLCGVSALLHLNKVSQPLITQCIDQQIKIVDNGYFWLQIAPKNEHWWLTVMFDSECNLIQFYFDISLNNFILQENSYFEDLMLDIIMLPDGRFLLIDEDELESALQQHHITKEEYDLAKATANHIMEPLPLHFLELKSFCLSIFHQLLKKL